MPVEVLEIRLRKECPEIGWGSWKILYTGSSKALGMRYDWRGNSLGCCTTLTKNRKRSEFVLASEGGERRATLMKEEENHNPPSVIHKMAPESDGYRWPRVGDLN